MPFCPLNVSELPLKYPSASPRVVDVEKYMESSPDVYMSRKSMAPLDATVTCLWMINPRCLQQFLNHRLPLFVFQIQRKYKEVSWTVIIMRQKISDYLHLIDLEINSRTKDQDGSLTPVTTKLHYIADGRLLRFEYHDTTSNCSRHEMFLRCKIITPARLAKMSESEKDQLYVAFTIFETECVDVLDLNEPTYSCICDGKWKKPDDLIVCPRLKSRGMAPLVDFWEEEYLESKQRTIKALNAFDVQLLPLWRRCVCQGPACKSSVDEMELDNVKRKMQKFCKIKPYRNTHPLSIGSDGYIISSNRLS